MKKILLFVLACIFSLSLTAFVACRGASDGDGNDYTLEVETEISLNIYDEERKISVKSNNPNEDVEFRCESSILTVLKDGTIIANEAGTATVYVICGNLEKECLITVRDTNENPVITVDGIDEDLGLAINEAFPLDYSLIIANKSISGQFTFSVQDSEILSVSDDGIITAKKEGQSDLYITCSYKKWTVDKTITVSVVSDVVVRLSENRINLTTVSGVNGFDTNKTVEFLGVFNGENKINGASIIWRTLDASVATVSDGVISAVGNGKTYVKAVYSNGGKDYAAYVLVNVQDPKLSVPTNFRVEDDMLIWDAVEGASAYVLLDGYNTATTNNTSLKLATLNPSENYFHDRSFMVYAISNNEKITSSGASQCAYNFKSMSLSDRLINMVDSYEASVEEVHIADWEADVPICFAKCNSKSLPGGDGMYGYCFRKVYYTEMAGLQYGINGTAGKWCINSFINPASPADFYDSKITFWAYAEQETTIYYMALTDGYWNRVVYYQATIPAKIWTQFSCMITEKDFPYITMLTASGDFYFADFRISKLSYVTKDYSNISVAEERLAETLETIDKLPTVSTTLEYGISLMNARNKYEALSDGVKKQVSNYSELIEKESAYGEIIYDTIKNNSDVKNVMSMYASYIDSYQPVTLNTFTSYEAKASEIENAMIALEPGEYYGLKYSDEYAAYLSVREDYYLVENTKGSVSSRIGGSGLVADNGFAGIDGVDTTSSEVAEALQHPTYGAVLTMGNVAQKQSVITFKNKIDIDLSGYEYVMFGVRNPRSEPMSVVLYGNSGIVKTLKSNIGFISHYATYMQVVMTVQEFMDYDLGFVYDEKPSDSANTWLTSFIAVKLSVEEKANVNELNGLLTELSGEIKTESKAKIDRAKELYNSLSSTTKSLINGYSSIISDAEFNYGIVATTDYINSIGTVTDTVESASKIYEARQAYDALTDAQKAEISNYQTLIDAEEELSSLLNDENIGVASQEIALLLSEVNSVSLESFVYITEKISSIDNKLSQLTEVQKYVVKDIGKYNELKSSFVVVDNMQGADIASRFTMTNLSEMYNGTTMPKYANELNHSVYGPCALAVKSVVAGDIQVKWNNVNNLDLSGYDRIIVGVRNGLSKALNFYTDYQNDSGTAYINWLYKDVPANMDTQDYVTLIMTVDDFLTYGLRTNAETKDAHIWFTSIIAVKGSAIDSMHMNVYKNALSDFNVELSDMRVLDDMLGADITERIDIGGEHFVNGTTFIKWAESLYNATYGRMAGGVLGANQKRIIRLNNVTNADLEGYTHIVTTVYNGTGLPITVSGNTIESANAKMVVISIEEYLSQGIMISSPIGNSAGSFNIGPIVAVKMSNN